MQAEEPSSILIGKGEGPQRLWLPYANRHGLIAGATGTGKTVSLQVLAEGLSSQGVPVFLADVKGDLGGVSQPGDIKPKLQDRAAAVGVTDYAPMSFRPPSGTCSADRDTQSAPRSPTWGRCSWRGCST